MVMINKKIFCLVLIAVSALFINPCFAMSDEALIMYNQIVSKSNDLDKYIQDINASARQIDKFKQEAENIKKDYKNTEQININESARQFEKLRLKEEKYIASLPIIQAKKEFDDVIILVKEFLPKLQQEKFMLDEAYTDYTIAKELTVASQTLQKAAEYNEKSYNIKLEIIQQQKLQQLEIRDLTIAQRDYLKNKIANQKAKMAGINSQLAQLEKDTKENEAQLESARKTMQQVINDQKKLKKYFWIPFYGFYWACKNLDNDVNKKYEHALNRARQLTTQLENYQKEKSNLNFELSNLKKEIQNAQNNINEYNKSLDSYVQQINSLTQIKVKYSDIIVEIGKIIHTLEYNSNSVKAILNVIESINFK